MSPIDEDREDSAQHREEARRIVAEGCAAWEYDQDMNGGGEPLDSFTIYSPDEPEAGPTPDDDQPRIVGTVHSRKDARLATAAPFMLAAHRRNAALDIDAIRAEGRLAEVLRAVVQDARVAIAAATGSAT
jgi:hypothetical protein